MARNTNNSASTPNWCTDWYGDRGGHSSSTVPDDEAATTSKCLDRERMSTEAEEAEAEEAVGEEAVVQAAMISHLRRASEHGSLMWKRTEASELPDEWMDEQDEEDDWEGGEEEADDDMLCLCLCDEAAILPVMDR